MAYRVEIAPAAARQIRRLPIDVQRRIAVRIDNLASAPRPRGTEELVGEAHTYRVRVGDYRILFDVADTVMLVLVVTVGHRREVHRSR